jgi:Domain of unknown function (DUF4407)
MRDFFSYFCGVDAALINSCSEDDKNRYLALGIMVFLLFILALVFSGYALTFILIQVAKHSLFQRFLEYGFAFSLSLCWAFIVLNFYRLIIGSTGVGDGTSQVTLTELLTFIPKLVITIVMASVVCVPMTIWVLRSEIEHLPSEIQLSQINTFNKQIEAEYSGKLLELYVKQVGIKKQLEENILKKNALESNLIDTKTIEAKATLDKFDTTRRELNADLALVNIPIKKMRGDILRLEEANSTEIINSTTLVADLGRVLYRHKPLFIFMSFFLMFIHIFPLFVRMIWVKGSYEFSVEFQEDIVMKKFGIIKNYRKFKDGYVSKFTIPELILSKEKEKHFKSRRKSISKFIEWRRTTRKSFKDS